MQLCVVVARYNEDVSWTKQLLNVVIYNKGLPLAGIIQLPNIGRESHTFFKYICDNYETLFEYTAFLQGHPFDHCPDVLHQLSTLTSTLPFEFKYLAKDVAVTNPMVDVFYPRLRMVETYLKTFGYAPDPDMKIEFGLGAQCIVSRNAIRKRPLSFYQHILTQFGDYHYKNLDESARLNRLEPWTFERLMKEIFVGAEY